MHGELKHEDVEALAGIWRERTLGRFVGILRA